MRLVKCILLAYGLVVTLAQGASVQVVYSSQLAKPAQYGIARLCEAIGSRGLLVDAIENVEQADGPLVIVAGLSSDPWLAAKITEAKLALPEKPESLAVCDLHENERHIVVLCGADAQGLMYAALDTAQRIRWTADGEHLFAHLRDTSEVPCLVDRSVSMYTMQRRWFEQRLYDATYWMEQLGLPFHPTHVNPQNQRDRRHGYADLLRYPKQYDVHWRVWSGGTSRFLLWGDPAYVRRIVTSAQIYGGDSFEVNEMLATKMLGESHDAEPFQLHTPGYRHYDYEFERYWYYYQVWGRFSYNPHTDVEAWQPEFVRRFGEESGPLVMRALHRASGILPRIVAASYNYRYFPTTRGWAEMMRLGDLPQYAEGTGTDVEQFQSYAEAARQLLSGQPTALRTPQQTAAWFASVARQVLDDVEAAMASGDQREGRAKRELLTTTTDLRILAHLAEYHAARMRAAVWYHVYLECQDELGLDQCLAAESDAIAAWKRIIAAAGDVYPETLQFGVHRVGFSRHWKEELAKLENGFAKLQQLPRKNTLDDATRVRLLVRIKPPTGTPLSIHVQRAPLAKPGQDLIITAKVDGTPRLDWIRLRYRHLTQFEDYRTEEMVWDPQRNKFAAVIPGNFIVPQWDVIYFVEAVDQRGHGRKVPDLEEELPYVIVPVQR